MKRQKILYVITKSVWGGAQRYVFDLATNLPKERFKIMVAAGGNGHLIRKLNAAGVATITIPHLERDINPVKEMLSLWSLFKIFREERPDVVHLNSSKIGGLGAVAAHLAGVPKIIFTAHGWAFQEPRTWWQRASIVFLSWLAARFQNHIINISRRDFDATLAYRIASTKSVVLIPLGITAPSFLPRDKAREFLSQRTGRKIPPDTALVGTIAELTRNKGLVHLIDAVNQMKIQNLPILSPAKPEKQNRGSSISRPNPADSGEIGTNSKFQTVIIGGGEEKENLQNQINSLGLQNTVHLAGFIPDAAQYLKAFDIFVLPSLKEGLPYTLLEARMSGIPIAASDVGGVPDIIEHQKNGLLVPPKDSKALAEAITGMLDNPTTVTKEWPSLEEMVEKTTALYT